MPKKNKNKYLRRTYTMYNDNADFIKEYSKEIGMSQTEIMNRLIKDLRKRYEYNRRKEK